MGVATADDQPERLTRWLPLCAESGSCCFAARAEGLKQSRDLVTLGAVSATSCLSTANR